jgi:hypothetical protein
MLTYMELSDVADKPKVMLDLPSPLHIGQRLRLAFRLRRQHAGRSEVLEVSGIFRVSDAGLDLASRVQRQLISVEATTISPHWKAVKKTPEPKRVLPPAVAPRKTIE